MSTSVAFRVGFCLAVVAGWTNAGLAARGATPAAFGWRCIPAGCVAPPSNIHHILGRRALPAGRIASLGATRELHHGLLAQPLARKATTVSGLLNYPVFFHGQRVVVRGRLTIADTLIWLADGDLKVLCPGGSPPGDEGAEAEVTGTFWDVGRLEPGDARLAPHDFARIAEQLVREPWPRVGELLALVAEASPPATPPPAPTIRSLALDPQRYVDQHVTVSGRFRGRNLYGDLPEAPRRSRWDFVLQSADAAIWVTGVEPRGRGFRLDVDARVDTGRWLEVSGVVRAERGLIWIEATDLTLAQPPADTSAMPVEIAPRQGPAPEVVFSAPTQEETDVARNTTVRIQFSRDMDAASFKGRVRVSYFIEQSAERGEPPPPPIEFTTQYHDGNRVLEIRFTQPLDRFRTLKVELLEGIAARDGAAMARAWTLTFLAGG